MKKKTIATKCLNRAQKALADGVEGIINEMKSRGISILSTESNTPDGIGAGDTIYAYALDGEFSEVYEREVKGIYLTDYGSLYICIDLHCVYYRPEDLEKEFDNMDSENVFLLWHNGHMFYDDLLQTDMTAMCILRDIDSYLC